MRKNGAMSDPALAPRNALGGMVVVWVVGALAALAVGILVPQESLAQWLIIAFGGCLLLSFVIQLAYGVAQGFIVRVAGSTVGALLVMGIVSAIFGLFALVTP